MGGLEDSWEKLLEEYSYELPEERIARFPYKRRDFAKLLIVDRKRKHLEEKRFYEIKEMLSPGDLLVLNNTRVEKRRVYLRRHTGAKIEAVFLYRIDPTKGLWRALLTKRKRLKDGEYLYVIKKPEVRFQVISLPDGRVYLKEPYPLSYWDFEEIGEVPIPPYLKREATKEDEEFYQTVYAKKPGSVASPTAGLHFTKELLEAIQKKGVQVEYLTLHVNYGTFSPLKEENFQKKALHPEEYEIPPSLAKKLQKKEYTRLIAVGTTTLRALETVYQKTQGRYDAYLKGVTTSFYYPPYKIQSVDSLITNFHLPRSSLLLLVGCMVEREFLLASYQYALKKGFLFYSYGDAMWIV